jgi:hypothetical protein
MTLAVFDAATTTNGDYQEKFLRVELFLHELHFAR